MNPPGTTDTTAASLGSPPCLPSKRHGGPVASGAKCGQADTLQGYPTDLGRSPDSNYPVLFAGLKIPRICGIMRAYGKYEAF